MCPHGFHCKQKTPMVHTNYRFPFIASADGVTKPFFYPYHHLSIIQNKKKYWLPAEYIVYFSHASFPRNRNDFSHLHALSIYNTYLRTMISYSYWHNRAPMIYFINPLSGNHNENGTALGWRSLTFANWERSFIRQMCTTSSTTAEAHSKKSIYAHREI